MSVKEQVLQAIQRLPDDIDYRDIADEIAFLAAIREAETDITEGRVISNEEMKARMESAPVDANIVELLEKRFADYLADPSQAKSAEKVFEQLAEQKRK